MNYFRKSPKTGFKQKIGEGQIKVATKLFDKWLVCACLSTPKEKLIRSEDEKTISLEPKFDGDVYKFSAPTSKVDYILSNWRFIHNYSHFLSLRGEKAGQGLFVRQKYVVTSRLIRIVLVLYGILLWGLYSISLRSKYGKSAQKFINDKFTDAKDKILNENTAALAKELVSLASKQNVSNRKKELEAELEAQKKNQGWVGWARGSKVQAEHELDDLQRDISRHPSPHTKGKSPIDNISPESKNNPKAVVDESLHIF